MAVVDETELKALGEELKKRWTNGCSITFSDAPPEDFPQKLKVAISEYPDGKGIYSEAWGDDPATALARAIFALPGYEDAFRFSP